MSATILLGLVLGLIFGASLLALGATSLGWKPTRPQFSTSTRATPWLLTSANGKRVAIAAGVAVLAALITRWPVAAGAAAAVVYLWPSMFGGKKAADEQLSRLEALATWTESLRDSIAGSVGLEEAIRHSVTAAPPAIQPALQRLEGRIRVQVPLTRSLAAFAEEFEDSSADLVVASLILNSRLRGPGLLGTLSALSVAAREEVDMRRRIEEGRKSLRRTALIIVGSTATFAGGLVLFSRDYVAPYSSPLGQVMLAIVLAVFAAGLVWIRSAANLEPPARFLVDADEVDAAMAASTSAGGRR